MRDIERLNIITESDTQSLEDFISKFNEAQDLISGDATANEFAFWLLNNVEWINKLIEDGAE